MAEQKSETGKTFRLEILNPERLVVSENVEAVVIPALDGALGILRNHVPLIGGLDIGVIRYRTAGKYHTVACNLGTFEMFENTLRILADTAERGDSIDLMRAREAKKRAEMRLREKKQDLDHLRAELALKRAIAREKAAAGARKAH